MREVSLAAEVLHHVHKLVAGCLPAVLSSAVARNDDMRAHTFTASPQKRRFYAFSIFSVSSPCRFPPQYFQTLRVCGVVASVGLTRVCAKPARRIITAASQRLQAWSPAYWSWLRPMALSCLWHEHGYTCNTHTHAHTHRAKTPCGSLCAEMNGPSAESPVVLLTAQRRFHSNPSEPWPLGL